MSEENISQEFKLQNIDATTNVFIEEINQNKLKIKKHKIFVRLSIQLDNYLVWLLQLLDVSTCFWFF